MPRAASPPKRAGTGSPCSLEEAAQRLERRLGRARRPAGPRDPRAPRCARRASRRSRGVRRAGSGAARAPSRSARRARPARRAAPRRAPSPRTPATRCSAPGSSRGLPSGARTYPSLRASARRYPAAPSHPPATEGYPATSGSSWRSRCSRAAPRRCRRAPTTRASRRASTPRSRAPALRGARVSALVVVRRATGASSTRASADRALVPASNQKILTALAALSAFGPAHRFRTELLADRAARRERARWARSTSSAAAIPGSTTEQWWRLAADLRARGLRARARRRARRRPLRPRRAGIPSWGAVSSRAYHAPVGALGANYGAFTAWVAGGRAAPATRSRVRIDPPVAVLRDREPRAHRRRAARRYRFQVERQAGARGRARRRDGLAAGGRAGRSRWPRSVADPTRYAGAVLRAAARGGRHRGRAGRCASRRRRPAPRTSTTSTGRASPRLLVPFLKWSHNVVGETLLQGPRARSAARRAGASPRARRRCAASSRASALTDGALVVVDGSGLSYRNRATPRTLVDALRARARRASTLGPELEAGLPIAGTDGTLRRRGDGRARTRAREDRAAHAGRRALRLRRRRPTARSASSRCW